MQIQSNSSISLCICIYIYKHICNIHICSCIMSMICVYIYIECTYVYRCILMYIIHQCTAQTPLRFAACHPSYVPLLWGWAPSILHRLWVFVTPLPGRCYALLQQLGKNVWFRKPCDSIGIVQLIGHLQVIFQYLPSGRDHMAFTVSSEIKNSQVFTIYHASQLP